MHLRSLILAAAASALFASQAFALNLCESRVNDVPDILVPGAIYIASTTGGKDGWDGQGGQCTKPGSSRIWVGPRSANGTCLTAASIIGTAPGQTLAKKPDTIIITPDDPEYRIGFYFDPPGPAPKVWVGTNWKDGTCP